MKVFLACAVIASVVLSIQCDLWDEINLEAEINDEAKFKVAHECFMDRGPCEGYLKEVKETVPKWYKSGCSECTPKQKEVFEKGLKLISEKYPKEFEEAVKHFDTPKIENTPKQEKKEEAIVNAPSNVNNTENVNKN